MMGTAGYENGSSDTVPLAISIFRICPYRIATPLNA